MNKFYNYIMEISLKYIILFIVAFVYLCNNLYETKLQNCKLKERLLLYKKNKEL